MSAAPIRSRRNLDVTAGVRYKARDRDRLPPLTDDRRDSQAVYVGTAFQLLARFGALTLRRSEATTRFRRLNRCPRHRSPPSRKTRRARETARIHPAKRDRRHPQPANNHPDRASAPSACAPGCDRVANTGDTNTTSAPAPHRRHRLVAANAPTPSAARARAGYARPSAPARSRSPRRAPPPARAARAIRATSREQRPPLGRRRRIMPEHHAATARQPLERAPTVVAHPLVGHQPEVRERGGGAASPCL